MRFRQEPALRANGITGTEGKAMSGGAHSGMWVRIDDETPRRSRGWGVAMASPPCPTGPGVKLDRCSALL